MKLTIQNQRMLENAINDLRAAFEKYKTINLSFDKSHKPKTMAQMGFLFAALIDQITDYFTQCGFILDQDDVRYKLYDDVSQIVPEMIVDKQLFGGRPRVKHINEMDRELMSKFIDGIFTVLDQDPIYSGLKLTPDTHYNWAYHITPEDLMFIRQQDFPERDADYLEYVRTMPCLICGMQHRSEAHHIRDTRTAGMAIKSPDWFTIPLCHACHLGVAHGTGFHEALKWIPLDMLDFCKICYSRWKNKNNT